MSADNFCGIWFDGAKWLVDTCSASVEFTARAQLEKHFAGARGFATRALALEYASDLVNQGGYEYGMQEIKTPEGDGSVYALAADVRERFKEVEVRIAAVAKSIGDVDSKALEPLTNRVEIYLNRVDATEKAIIGHEGQLQQITAQMKRNDVDMPAWLKLVATVERSVDRLDVLEAAAKPKAPMLKRHDSAPLTTPDEAMAAQAEIQNAKCVACGVKRREHNAIRGDSHEFVSEYDVWYLCPVHPGVQNRACCEAVRRQEAKIQRVIQEVVRKAVPYTPDVFTERDARPTIVCLCGSTKFFKAFRQANLEETLAGKIVLTVGSMMHSDAEIEVCVKCKAIKGTHTRAWDEGDFCDGHVMHHFLPLTAPGHTATKINLDKLHKKKIEMADEVFVLNAMRCKVCGRAQDQSYDNWGHGNECRYFRSTGPFPEKEYGWAPYIGDSTKSEIEHAIRLKKRIRFLHPHPPSGASVLYENDTSGNTVEESMYMLGLGPKPVAASEPRKHPGMYTEPRKEHLGTMAPELLGRDATVRRNGIPINCDTCINKCMDMDMDPYCIAVNRPYGSVLTRPRPKECAGEDGKQYLLWERDTRGRGGE